MNLYGFVRNRASDAIDILGLEVYPNNVPPPYNPPPRPGGEPKLIMADSCRGCGNVQAALNLVYKALGQGKCKKWFLDHGSKKDDTYVLTCRTICNPVSWIYTTWAEPGIGISLAKSKCDLGPVNLASLFIHELGHKYGSILLTSGAEANAESAQEACEDELIR